MGSNGRRMPVRTTVITFTGDYEDFSATVRTNVPMGVMENLVRADKVYQTLTQIVREWNLVDDDGEPLPVTEEGMKRVPIDLFWELQREVGRAINSPLAEKMRPA
jgi:hypothetical protein